MHLLIWCFVVMGVIFILALIRAYFLNQSDIIDTSRQEEIYKKMIRYGSMEETIGKSSESLKDLGDEMKGTYRDKSP